MMTVHVLAFQLLTLRERKNVKLISVAEYILYERFFGLILSYSTLYCF